MRTRIVFAALLGVAAVAATPAEARINQRQAHQQQRIARGVADGQLTARETYRLERQEGRIAAYEAHSRADGGGLSARERVRIEHMQDRESRRIYRQRHDAQHQ
jgi:membrane protein implicated in regulation of membrane protease activity